MSSKNSIDALKHHGTNLEQQMLNHWHEARDKHVEALSHKSRSNEYSYLAKNSVNKDHAKVFQKMSDTHAALHDHYKNLSACHDELRQCIGKQLKESNELSGSIKTIMEICE